MQKQKRTTLAQPFMAHPGSSLHMVVEAVFWFHPIVWWIGARLVQEREQACDEEVLRAGSSPRAYAEAILHVCRRYVQVPLANVAGIGRPDVRSRIDAIMAERIGAPLSATCRIARAVRLRSADVSGAPLPVDAGSATEPGFPSFTEALEEYLGLKLESAQGPVDVLVIDSVQQPTEN